MVFVKRMTATKRQWCQRSWTQVGLGFMAAFSIFGGTTPMAHAAAATYEVVTNEIAAKQKDGSYVEVYRFDPGVFVVEEGDEVTLKLRGLKGQVHPVVLEGYHLKTVINRNEVATLHFRATKPGMFRLVCTAHADAAHEGPMEGYLIVMPHAGRH